jgi:hypothetical protein
LLENLGRDTTLSGQTLLSRRPNTCPILFRMEVQGRLTHDGEGKGAVCASTSVGHSNLDCTMGSQVRTTGDMRSLGLKYILYVFGINVAMLALTFMLQLARHDLLRYSGINPCSSCPEILEPFLTFTVYPVISQNDKRLYQHPAKCTVKSPSSHLMPGYPSVNALMYFC